MIAWACTPCELRPLHRNDWLFDFPLGLKAARYTLGQRARKVISAALKSDSEIVVWCFGGTVALEFGNSYIFPHGDLPPFRQLVVPPLNCSESCSDLSRLFAVHFVGGSCRDWSSPSTSIRALLQYCWRQTLLVWWRWTSQWYGS